MSYSNGPQTVTNGLVFYVDAGNSRSYPGTGTTWTDLTKNSVNNLSLTNVSTASASTIYFNNDIFNNTTSYAAQTTSLSAFINPLSGGCSAFVWFNNTALLSSSVPGYYRQTAFGYGYDATLGGWQIERFYTNSNFVLRYHFDQDGTYGNTANYNNTNINQWTQLGFTNNGSVITLYQDGIAVNQFSIATKTLTLSGLDNAAALSIGAYSRTSGHLYGFIGYVGAATFYNRALSQTEVYQNFNALRGRFGL